MDAINYIVACRGYVRFGISDNPLAQIAAWQEGSPHPIDLVGGWVVPSTYRFDVLSETMTAFADQQIGDTPWFRVGPVRAERELSRRARDRGGEYWPAARIRRQQRPAVSEHGNSRSLMTPRGKFPSATAAARAFGITRQTVSMHALKRTPGWYYLGDAAD